MAENTEKMWWDDEEKFPVLGVSSVNPDVLDFDIENPRYTPDKDLPHNSELEIIQFYDKTSDLYELLQSISQSGYVGIEPLIVMGKDEKLIVLEGNRRLAAIRLLKNSALAAKCEINVPSIEKAKLETLNLVTVYRVSDREQARDYIGFKHINGPHKWDSFAKARYAIDWLDQEGEKENGLTLSEIADRMGDGHSTILRMVNGYHVLQQAIENDLFKIEDREKKRQFSFSHLYTALTRVGIKKHLGLEGFQNNEMLNRNPIHAEKLSALKEVMIWIYGSDPDEIRAVVRTQNPDIKRLSEVLENPKAKAILVANENLNEAYEEVDPPSTQFERQLLLSHKSIEKSMSKVSAYSGDRTLLDVAVEIDQKVAILIQNMHSKCESNEK